MESGERNIILVEDPTHDSIKYVVLKSRLAVHRITDWKDSNQYKPSRVDVTRRGLKSYERNARGRRKRAELLIEYESEEELPEPEPEPIVEDKTDKDGEKEEEKQD